MKIYSKTQIYAADQATLKKENIASIDLMERAAGYVFQWLHHRLKNDNMPIKVFCGIGNNGGDGLVIARSLMEEGYTVTTYVVNYSDHRSDDFLLAYSRLKAKTSNWPIMIKSEEDIPEVSDQDLVIDAIFGIGYDRPAAGWVQQLINVINAAKAYVLSVDIPSGLYMDAVPAQGESVIHATVALTFQAPKLIFFLPETGKYLEHWEVIDIGQNAEFLAKTKTNIYLIDTPEAKQIYKPRTKFSHKGTYGHALIIGGSYGKIGAVILAATACLKAGSGLVSCYVPQFAMPILQTALPEAMVLTDRHNGKVLEEITFDLIPDVIGIGIGMGTEKITVKAFKDFLEQNATQLVIDADALNIFSKHRELLGLLPRKTILTPHPKELQRLIGDWKDDFDKLEKATAFAKAYDLVLVIKGANTMTLYEDQIYINATGNPGLATGGTGDVLTGTITGLLAQGYEPLDAAIFGVYLHGRAADLAVKETSYEGMSASDVANGLGRGYLEVYKRKESND